MVIKPHRVAVPITRGEIIYSRMLCMRRKKTIVKDVSAIIRSFYASALPMGRTLMLIH